MVGLAVPGAAVWLSTVVDYFVGRTRRTPPAKLALAPACEAVARTSVIAVNLGILGVLQVSSGSSSGSTAEAFNCGHDCTFEANLPLLKVVLPVGISFYTFQTLAYTIDVYRRPRGGQSATSVVFALYVCYFPQLVAGPIERAQTDCCRNFGRSPGRSIPIRSPTKGPCSIFLRARPQGWDRRRAWLRVVDEIFSDAHRSLSSVELLALGVFLFAIQIYGDFAGYSSIARGSIPHARHRADGKLPPPVLLHQHHRSSGAGGTSLCRRWLRDYLYIPLGGNRGSRYATYRNLMLTMLLGGLWHGASWTFVVWGAIHGVALAVHKLATGNRKILDNPDLSSPRAALLAVPAWIGTMVVVLAAWVFFRAPTFDVAWNVFTGIAALRGKLHMADAELVVLSLLWLFVFDIPAYRRREPIGFLRTPWPVRGFVYAVSVLAMVLLERKVEATFIYFQF